MAFIIEVAVRQSRLLVDENQLRRAAAEVLAAEGFASVVISIAVVDDPTIHRLNRDYLDHDYATDVLSFVLEESDESLEGEIIVSADTAIREAEEIGWEPLSELLLYVVHGLLHLAGYDDHAEEDRQEMRRLEKHYLGRLGVSVPE